ncbi:putative Reverse transcriptase (RNA dependent DNA polymerase) [Trypanosoma vivax]|nr:putative Reverse transcriptase (RNA dependent DNA polymerase) [Trypanosoma vivax]
MLRLSNCNLCTEKAPAKCRHGIVVMLLKPNMPAGSMASFRPVALTSMLRKLTERSVARRVRDCVEDELKPKQARFRPARSTPDTPMQVTSAVWRNKGGEKTAAVFIDYTRAFDSVNHGCIVKELLSFGVDRWLPEGAHGTSEGEHDSVGGYRPHPLCPSGFGAGTTAVHCHGGLAELAAQLRPCAAAWVLRGRSHNCVRERWFE